MPIVKFELCRNPKTMRSGVGLLRLVQDSDVQGGDAQDSRFEWVRPLQRDRTSATYDLEPGFYVLVTDTSSHKNARKNWTIIQVIPEGAAVVREEAKAWRENSEWACSWWGKEGGYSLIAQIAAAHKGRRAAEMSVIEILDAFFECAIQRLENPEHRHDAPPPGG
jgi:hypothetical protein